MNSPIGLDQITTVSSVS